jgi:hypothetical protein
MFVCGTNMAILKIHIIIIIIIIIIIAPDAAAA